MRAIIVEHRMELLEKIQRLQLENTRKPRALKLRVLSITPS